jgi:hypothetical protein
MGIAASTVDGRPWIAAHKSSESGDGEPTAPTAPRLQRLGRMRAMVGVLCLVAGCAGGGGSPESAGQGVATAPQAAASCVTVGGGELQIGLTLGLGGGDVRVVAVEDVGGRRVGFAFEATAPDVSYIVTSGSDSVCAVAPDWSGSQTIDRVTFCTGAGGCR